MERVAQSEAFDLWFDRIDRPYSFTSPFSGKDFVLMMVVADPSVTETERADFSDQIIQAGCRYAVCAGHDCSRWDDSIDLAYIATHPNFCPPDERFVMTTWHQNES